MREVNWGKALEDLPTECSRGHETVTMVNHGRKVEEDRNVSLKFFCPSCHQKMQIRARIGGGGRFFATGYEILEEGSL